MANKKTNNKATALPQGKPYTEINISGKEAKELQESFSQKVTQYIIDNSPSPNNPKDVHKYTEEYINRNVRGLGKLTLLDDTNPIYRDVQQATIDYNNAHPDTPPLDMPRYIVQSKTGKYAYAYKEDILFVSKNADNSPPEERKAIFTHELGHKSQAINGKNKTIEYNVENHAEIVSPKLNEICAIEEISKEQIKKSLPSNNRKSTNSSLIDPRNSLEENILNTEKDIAIEGFLQIIKSPIETAKLKWKLFNSDCENEIDKVYDSLLEALSITQHGYLKHSRELESDADSHAAETYRAELIITALGNNRADNVPQDKEHRHTHPSLSTRAEDLGCKLGYDDKENIEVECPITPNDVAHNTSTIKH